MKVIHWMSRWAIVCIVWYPFSMFDAHYLRSFVLKYFTLTICLLFDCWEQKMKKENYMFISEAKLISIQCSVSLRCITFRERTNWYNTSIIISHTNLENEIFKCNVNHIINLTPNRRNGKTSQSVQNTSYIGTKWKKIFWIKWENPLRDSIIMNWRLR